LATPLVSEPARDREPDRDLNSEDLSVKLEDEPSEAPKFSARPANRADARPSEPDRDLNRELFSAKLEAAFNVAKRF